MTKEVLAGDKNSRLDLELADMFHMEHYVVWKQWNALYRSKMEKRKHTEPGKSAHILQKNTQLKSNGAINPMW